MKSGGDKIMVFFVPLHGESRKNSIDMKMKKLVLTLLALMLVCGVKAQVKVCMSYDDYKANQWKPYESLTEDKQPDSCRIKYDGQNFIIKTNDKEVNNIIKKDVFLMSVDGQLFINSKMLRDQNNGVLPVNHFLRALPYKGDKLLVVSYHVSLGTVLDLVNIGLDVALIATGHYTFGGIFLATDLLLTNDDLMETHVLFLVDKAPNAKGRYIMTRLNDQYMEELLRSDPITFSKYQGCNKKSVRQSACNILPILADKGLITDYRKHAKK